MAAQNYDEAINQLTALIQTSPGFLKAYIKIAEAYQGKNELDRGLNFFTTLAETAPHNPYVYQGLGLIFKAKNNYQKAIEYYHRTIQLDPENYSAYKELIDTYNQMEKLEDGADDIKNMIQSDSKNPTVYYALGYYYQVKRNFIKGLENLNKAMELHGNPMEINQIKGAIQYFCGEYQNLLNLSEKSLQLAMIKNDLEFQCVFSGYLGLAYLYLSDDSTAIQYCTQSLILSRELGDRPKEVSNLINIGMAYQSQMATQSALDYFHEALQKSLLIGDIRKVGVLYCDIGYAYSLIGDYACALEFYKKLLDLLKDTDDVYLECIGYNSIGYTYWELGDYTKAIEYGELGIQSAQKMGNKLFQTRNIVVVGLAYSNLGKYIESLNCFHKGLELARDQENLYWQGICLGNIGMVYDILGNPVRSLECYHRAIEIAKTFENKNEIGRALNNIGNLYYYSICNYDSAYIYYKQALQIAEETDNLRYQVDFLGNIGCYFILKGEYESAEKYLNKALKTAEELHYHRGKANQHLNLGNLHLDMKRFTTAHQDFRTALEIGQQISEQEIVWQAQEGIASVYQKQRKYKNSVDHYQLAITAIENIRTTLIIDELRIGFFRTKIQIYEHFIQLLAKLHEQYPSQGYDKKAFHYAERAKARSFLDIAAHEKEFHHLKEIPPDFREHFLVNQKELLIKHTALSKELQKTRDAHDKNRIFLLENEIEALEREKAGLIKEMKEKSPDFYQWSHPKILHVDDVQIDVLDKKQCLIEYFVAQENLFVWLITKDCFIFKTVHLTKNELKSKLTQISPLFIKEKSDALDSQIDHRWAHIRPDMLHALYQLLLEKPAGDFLRAGVELIIVPDDMLFYFPFEMLVRKMNTQNIQYLAEVYPVSYTSSASLLHPELRKATHAENGLLAFGNPDVTNEQPKGILDWIRSLASYKPILRGNRLAPLPYAEAEVKEIANLFEASEVYTGQKATEANFKQQADKYRFIHLATHHIISDQQPMYSKIILAQTDDDKEDGYLQTYEIYNLDLNADLVSLSGCNTGLGQLARGEGLIGMTRAFLYAGVRHLVVSLWPVEDASTSVFMVHFYQYLKSGLKTNVALQKAKIDFIDSEDTESNPFYWAPFVLIGNPE
ncbi:CHAT domain-containing protein [bacterium]|nr:CHAT domain-containing protein [bacterium]